ncbi:MAG: hypothetical protein LBD23_16165 [Oscillospiraceae bacterium]|jgi:hypothetical protein|nr:hypothetical protein [Oscillospiraceae bacterium]
MITKVERKYRKAQSKQYCDDCRPLFWEDQKEWDALVDEYEEFWTDYYKNEILNELFIEQSYPHCNDPNMPYLILFTNEFEIFIKGDFI